MSVLTKLSDSAYWAMRKEMVQEVYKSETMTIADVARRHKISPSTLWKWCNEDLGPNQIKWLIEQSNKIRGQRISAKSKPTDAAIKKDMKNIMFNPAKDPALKVKPRAVVGDPRQKPMNKPWDKKKARALLVPSTSPNVPPGTLEVHQDIRSLIQSAPTVKPTLPVGRKLLGATVVLNLDEHGKFIKYEVTGDVSVQVFTRS